MFGLKNRRRSRSQERTIALEDRVLPAAVLVRAVPAGRGTFDITFQGSHEDDAISIFRDEGNRIVATAQGDTTLVVNGVTIFGPVELGTVRQLNLEMAGGNDRVHVEDIVAAGVHISDGFSSSQETNDYRISSRLMNSSIGALTGGLVGGNFDLVIETDNNRSLTIGTVAINSVSLSNSSVVFVGRSGLLNVTGRTTINHTNPTYGQDELVIVGESEVRFGGLVTYKTGVAGDGFVAEGNVDFRGGIRAEMGTGDDLFTLRPREASFDVPQVRGAALSLLMGDGNDTVNATSSSTQERITLFRGATIDTGNGNDFVELGEIDNLAGLTVKLGNHDPGGADLLPRDQLNIRRTSIRSSSRIESQGLATVTLSGETFAPTRFSSAVTFALGSGVVNVGDTSPGSRIAFNALHTFQGVISPLTVNFRGFVERNVRNQRMINALPG